MSKNPINGYSPREGHEQNEHLKSVAHNTRDEKSKGADGRAESTSGTDHDLSKLRKDRD